MSSDSARTHNTNFANSSAHSAASEPTRKPPRQILPGIFAFPPNRETLGATAYLIVEKDGNILVDCPAWEESNLQFLRDRGGVSWLFLTHRGAVSRVTQLQAALQCQVLVQEQEAYLLPEVEVLPFREEILFSGQCLGIWTCGYSPGSACLYYRGQGGVLFTGRHLLSDRAGNLVPLRMAKTFHWLRQLRSVAVLRDRFSEQTLHHICPGANTGFLRGKGTIDRAYERLTNLDLAALRQVEAGIF